MKEGIAKVQELASKEFNLTLQDHEAEFLLTKTLFDAGASFEEVVEELRIHIKKFYVANS